MKKLYCLVVIGFLAVFCSEALAKELLVLSGENSQNSKRWNEEVFPGYGDSDAGKNYPAKLVVIEGKNFPDWLTKAMQEGRVGEIIGTPTFILWDENGKKEMGRVEGYTKKDRFYSQINDAVEQVDQGMHPGRREGSGGHAEEEGSGGDQRKEEGSNSKPQQGGAELSRDIMDHMYKTPEEAKRASDLLGFGGEIHTHESPDGTIYMPGPMM